MEPTARDPLLELVADLDRAEAAGHVTEDGYIRLYDTSEGSETRS